MEKRDKQEDPSTNETKHQFDSILIRHMERLIGTGYGIEGLPLNLVTISCFALLAEQAANEMDDISTSSERYSQDQLFEELAEIGLDSTPELQASYQNMIKKGYIQLDSKGEIAVMKPTLSMAQLLDRLFPKMPGMNFVAYLIQTIDEVESGRKDLESALDQFDQTLRMMGTALKKEEAIPSERRQSKPLVEQKTLRKQSVSSQKIVRGDASGPKILSSRGKHEHANIRKLTFDHAQPDSPALSDHSTTMFEDTEFLESVAPVAPERFDETQIEETAASISDTDDRSEKTIPAEFPTEDTPPEILEVSHLENQESEIKLTEPIQIEDEPVAIEKDNSAENDLEADISERIDESIEDRIATFEEHLAMECPVCKVAKVEEKRTSKGKVYYTCPDKTCIFISWGKPHHRFCPRCNNPFLVEASDKNGRTVLKCPRATCRYIQRSQRDTIINPDGATSVSPKKSSSKKVRARKPRKRARRKAVRRKK